MPDYYGVQFPTGEKIKIKRNEIKMTAQPNTTSNGLDGVKINISFVIEDATEMATENPPNDMDCFKYDHVNSGNINVGFFDEQNYLSVDYGNTTSIIMELNSNPAGKIGGAGEFIKNKKP